MLSRDHKTNKKQQCRQPAHLPRYGLRIIEPTVQACRLGNGCKCGCGRIVAYTAPLQYRLSRELSHLIQLKTFMTCRKGMMADVFRLGIRESGAAVAAHQTDARAARMHKPLNPYMQAHTSLLISFHRAPINSGLLHLYSACQQRIASFRSECEAVQIPIFS